jgi:hypothetical protein
MATPPVTDTIGGPPPRGDAPLSISGPSGHLYVADAAGAQRFGITNGIPATTADLTYSGVYAPIALDSLHYLYAASSAGINVYSPGSTQLSRTIPITTLTCAGGYTTRYITSEAQVISMALDKNRYLFAGVSSASWVFHAASVGGYWIHSSSIAVRMFAPGTSSPFHSITEWSATNSVVSPPRCATPPHTAFDGLATDSSDELLLSNNRASPPVIDSESGIETSSPKQVRSITGTGVTNPNGLAVDAAGDLYVDNENGTSSFIAVYPVAANGEPAPIRKISVTGESSFGSGIDVASGRLFVPDPGGNAVYEISASASGAQTPTILHVTQPTDVKLGP